MQQTSFQKTLWNHRFSHGGVLRSTRAGRKARPISTKDPVHLVFKTNKGLSGAGLRSARRFALVQTLLRKYAKKFHVKIEQVSIQFDHVHLLVRVARRSLFQNFLRVLSGQVSQQFLAHGLSFKPRPPVTGTSTGRTGASVTASREQGLSLWKHRPFTRVVKGWKAYKVVRDYIQLNEKEVTGEIRYSKSRLRGLNANELAKLWG